MIEEKIKKEIPFYVETPYSYSIPKMEEKPKKKGIWVGFLLALGKVGSKAAPVVGKLLKGAKVTKVALAAGSVVSYAFLTTWTFAIQLIRIKNSNRTI